MDHVKNIREYTGSFWNEQNWQGLCVDCHQRKTIVENSSEEVGREWKDLIEWVSTR